MFGVRLHVGNCLDTARAGANNSNTVVLPLFLLIIVRPFRGVHDLALELLHSFNIRPLEIIQDASAVEEDVASLFELADRRAGRRVCLPEFDQPFSSLLLPVAADHLGVEGHVFSETPYLTHLVQVLPDVWAVGEEARPIGLWMQRNADARVSEPYFGGDMHTYGYASDALVETR